MDRTDRRFFMLRAVAVTSTLATVRTAARADVDESDAAAVALGYKEDTAKVDAAKYPTHAASQQCSNCKQFQGRSGERWGGCPLFGGKQVSAKGWCSGWLKIA